MGGWRKRKKKQFFFVRGQKKLTKIKNKTLEMEEESGVDKYDMME